MVSNKWDSSYAVQVYTVHYVQCKPDIVALEVKKLVPQGFFAPFCFLCFGRMFSGVFFWHVDTPIYRDLIWQPAWNWVPGGAGGADKTHILTSLELQDKCNVVVKMQTGFDSIHRGGLRYE